MSDIFMTAEQFEAAEAEAAEQERVARVAFRAWLSSQTPGFQALHDELDAIQTERRMTPGITASIARDKHGRLVYTVASANGVHQSYDGYEAALELLVDSFRTRVEDLESTHLRVAAALKKTLRGQALINDAAATIRRRRILSGRPPFPEADVLAAADRFAGRDFATEVGHDLRRTGKRDGAAHDAGVLDQIARLEASADRERAEREREAEAAMSKPRPVQ